ncbi:MAG: type II toxin-antitoxin system VapC family toxin [Zetaproteobacteria bacterium]|nr:type II toxin-antitoxin system VapC family toxin [Zetaproteobacteria bacterium]
MNIIIDTHIFLWAIAEPDKLEPAQKLELERLSNTIYLSAVSVTEMMIKASMGKLDVDYDPVAIARESGIELLDFSGEDALLLKDMPFHHRDPFDRMLIAQSTARGYPLMTNDAKMMMYDCPRI